MSVNLGPTPPRSPQKGYVTTGSRKNSGSDSDRFEVELAKKGFRVDTQAANDIFMNALGEDRDTPTPPPAGAGR